MERGVAFLRRSMGLSVVSSSSTNGTNIGQSRWLKWAKVGLFGGTAKAGGIQRASFSRALFEAGEVDSLRGAFNSNASTEGPAARADVGTVPSSRLEIQSSSPTSGLGPMVGEKRLKTATLRAVLREIPSYERTTEKELQYVLDEAGLSQQENIDFDEFVEVGEISFADCILFIPNIDLACPNVGLCGIEGDQPKTRRSCKEEG